MYPELNHWIINEVFGTKDFHVANELRGTNFKTTTICRNFKINAKKYVFKFPFEEKLITENMKIDIKNANIKCVELSAGDQVIAKVINSDKSLRNPFKKNTEIEKNILTPLPQMIPFAHKYHNLELIIYTDKSNGFLTIVRGVSTPTEKQLQLFSSNTVHQTTYVHPSKNMIKYVGGMCGLVIM